MRFNLVQNTVHRQIERFKSEGSLDPKQRITLIDAASRAETRRLTDEFEQSKAADQQPQDMSDLKNVLHTFRGPTERETVDRSLETQTTLKGDSKVGEMSTRQLATLQGDAEPYHDTYEFTQFQADGISHLSITVVGDGGVNNGAIVSMAEFLSPDPDKSWRERTQTDFIGQDLMAIYGMGTYSPTVEEAL